MTDARKDFAGAVNECNANLQSIAESLRLVIGEITLSMADIGKRQSVSRTTLSREPWRVPGFGAGCDAGKSPWRCYASTYAKWMAIPEAQRRTEWDLMPLHERRKIRAVSRAV